MVNLAMGSNRILTIFLTFWHPETPGSVSLVFADNQSENEIWNRLEQFLPVCLWKGQYLKRMLFVYEYTFLVSQMIAND